MTFPRLILMVLLGVECGFLVAQEPLTMISYNVENLFDCQHDTLKNDYSFLPDGDHHWTYHKYQTKLDRIAQVVVNISGWESAALVGLCEVENARCLRDLCYRLKRFHYQYVHYESEDERGIDVALLYDSTKVKVLDSRPLRVDLNEDNTRDILYVKVLLHERDTMYAMVCHLPSRLGGGAATEWKRLQAKQVIQQQIDSILHQQPQANIVVMGDMNDEAKNDLSGMSNQMVALEQAGQGTHKYQGVWSCLDQYYVSKELKDRVSVQIYSPEWLLEEDNKYLDYQPKRTFVGFRYHGGYSDHMPIVLTIYNK
ncbi:MAG: endonuclease [Paludibacteraceae bacterium]|nr:endonuclease [Paludibacteraceae bacterium]